MEFNNILYIHRTQAIGAEGAHIRGMVDGFKSLGCEVELFGPPGVNPYSHLDSNVSSLKKDLLWRKLLKSFSKYAPQFIFEIAELIYNYSAHKHLKKKSFADFNFIYERYALNSRAGCRLAFETGLPLVLEVNDATVIERSRPLSLTKMARRNEAIIFKQADVLITITNHFKELIVNEYKIDPERIIVLPNAVEPSHFKIQTGQQFSRQKLNIPESAVVLCCMGAFLPWHGLELLLETLGDDADRLDLFFLFIGDGPVRKSVEALGREKNISHRLLMTGFLPPNEVVKYLDLADICVLPDSNSHCSPMKLFEFMAMGKPVVLPDYEPLLDTIEDHQQGIFFKKKDRAGLKAALMTLIQSEALRQALGERAKERILAKHTWNQHARKVLDRVSKLKCEAS